MSIGRSLKRRRKGDEKNCSWLGKERNRDEDNETNTFLVIIALVMITGVGDIEGGPKGDILGQAGAGIGTEHCLDFPA